jgi:hypothetical protein
MTVELVCTLWTASILYVCAIIFSSPDWRNIEPATAILLIVISPICALNHFFDIAPQTVQFVRRKCRHLLLPNNTLTLDDFIGMELSGRDLQEHPAFAQLSWIKLTNADEIHHGLQYNTGFIHDYLQPFNTETTCSPGGIYLCQAKHASKWYKYADQRMVWKRLAIIPPQARVYIESECKIKVDCVHLSERTSLF